MDFSSMALPLYIYTLFGLVPFFALVRWKACRTLRKAAPSPPGPPGLPFLGTVSMLWERKPWLRFMEWKDEYGCRNKIYNGRPRSILISEMMTGGLAFPLVDYGELSLYSLFCSVGYGDANKDKASYHIRNFIGRIVHAAIPGSAVTDFFPLLSRLPSWLLPSKGRHLAQFQADNEEFVRLVSKSQLEMTSSVLPVFVLAMALYPAVQQRAQKEIDSVVGKGRFPTFQDRNKLPYVQAIVREVLRWRPIGPIGESKLIPTLSVLNSVFRFSEMLPSGVLYAFCSPIETKNLQDDLYKGYLIQAGA
ncbi:hypothetical protein HHX47_DHR7000142 [Lentinula edodes]|nr:hypothetical protein HHX47_DHR7000142 [Lentinula edodes]